MGCTGIAPPESRVTACVLEAETGLVSLGYFTSGGDVQQVVVAEGIHAVVVPVGVELIGLVAGFRNALKATTLLS